MAQTPTHAPGLAPAPTRALQPSLHDRVVTLRAPVAALSAPDGQMGAESAGVDGVYRYDRRLLRTLRVELPEARVDTAAPDSPAAHIARFTSVVRGAGEPTPDPVVLLEREREVRGADATVLVETVTLVSAQPEPITLTLDVVAGTDLATMGQVRTGAPPEPARAELPGDRARWSVPAAAVEVTVRPLPDGGQARPVTPEPVTSEPVTPEPVPGHPDLARFRARLTIPARGRAGLRIELRALRESPGTFAPGIPARAAFAVPSVQAGDDRFARLLTRSIADLSGLLLTDPDQPGDQFLAAGVPWFLTLFGRDSLWAARMLLPLGTELAAGTLRVLARRQGTGVDPYTEEQPGKILHEVRGGDLELSGLSLPAVYFGTIDATPLWACLLHDAWRYGMPGEQVAALLPHLRAALDWITGPGDADGDGFLEYAASSGGGLANQGWKDSGDSIQSAAGALAEGPVALCEVQAYAHEALTHGADLLEAFGHDAGGYRQAADRLRARFRSAFWVDDPRDPQGAYPAIALDGAKRPVAAVSSNIGHLLGTGLLDPAEESLVAARLAAPDMDSGHGLRTLSAGSAGFNPVGYHTGSVWPHDTAITARGLVAAGHPRVAASLLRGLVEAAPAFDYRLPELFGGLGAADGRPPVPYPAACRPQAWSAAASVHLLAALLGLEPDVPGGTLRVAPMRPSPVGALSVRGLRVAGEPLALRLDAESSVVLDAVPTGLRPR